MSKRRPSHDGKASATTLTVATYNIRWVLDYWERRWSLVKDAVVGAVPGKPDIVAFQEVCIGGGLCGQDALLSEALPSHRLHTAAMGREYLLGLWPMSWLLGFISRLPFVAFIFDLVAWLNQRFYDRVLGPYAMKVCAYRFCAEPNAFPLISHPLRAHISFSAPDEDLLHTLLLKLCQPHYRSRVRIRAGDGNARSVGRWVPRRAATGRRQGGDGNEGPRQRCLHLDRERARGFRGRQRHCSNPRPAGQGCSRVAFGQKGPSDGLGRPQCGT